ncbi:MAG: metallophosphoesterase [Pseudomonadota bacterium]
MYFRRKSICGAVFFALSAFLSGCGDDGDTGPQGPAGIQGETGPQGENATATVLVGPFFEENDQIITDPMLTGPADGEVSVVWYTTMPGDSHRVVFGDDLSAEVAATTTRMSQMFEDAGSEFPQGRRVGEPIEGEAVVEQDIYRHEARVTGLEANRRVPYYAATESNGAEFKSQLFSLQPLPSPDQPVKILITSDQQNRANAPANFEKVVETVGRVDAVFFAGDLVDTPNRASEWFYRGTEGRPAFFPSLQGFYKRIRAEHPYDGGQILQHAPLFATIGNHESPGIFDRTQSLGTQDNDPQPRWYANWKWSQLSPGEQASTGMTREEYVRSNSFDHVTYYEMWNLPENDIAGEDPENYYALRYGNVSLISMNVSRVWRSWNNGFGENDNPGKFKEPALSVNDLDRWGFGDMFFGDYSEGSLQRDWLREQLQEQPFTSAPFHVVLTHQSMHGYGDNSVPVMANPEATISFTDGSSPIVTTFPAEQNVWDSIVAAATAGTIEEVRYKYERSQDLWIAVEEELLAAGVDLVISGHSHVWSRTFVESADGERMNYIESSNVGNSFGPFAETRPRVTWARNFYPDPESGDTVDPEFWTPEDYPRVGDPQGRPDVVPTGVANGEDFMRMVDGATEDLPFLSSNNFTVFTILDSGDGTVRSYAHDVAFPQSPAYEVDCFALDASANTNPCGSP